MIEIEWPSWKSFRTHEQSKTLHFLVSEQKPWNLFSPSNSKWFSVQFFGNRPPLWPHSLVDLPELTEITTLPSSPLQKLSIRRQIWALLHRIFTSLRLLRLRSRGLMTHFSESLTPKSSVPWKLMIMTGWGNFLWLPRY